jgi:hypothetical protein
MINLSFYQEILVNIHADCGFTLSILIGLCYNNAMETPKTTVRIKQERSYKHAI